MALFEWKATTVARAFALNSIALGISIALTYFVADLLRDAGAGSRLLLQMLASSVSLYITFWAMHFVFGYGGGQLA